MQRARGYAAACSAVLLCCGTGTPSNDGDAAAGADSGAETSGAGGTAGSSGTGGSGAAGGASGGTSGAGGASGSTGGAGGASGGTGGAGGTAGGAGSGGTTGGRGGSQDGGGAAGSARGGQAGTAIGDAASDAADRINDASVSPDRAVDASAEGAADSTDARADASAPPSDAAECTPLPSAGVYATFRVVNDVFYASITNPPGIDQALALWRGQSQAKIPVGQLECGNGTYNCGWTWRMNPTGITFAEITIEVCDATPSYVQNNCASFPNGQYCPWSAELIALRDCRTDPSCPAVPR